MKSIYLFILLVVAFALVLILYLVMHEPVVQDGARKLAQDTQELGHEAVRGVEHAAVATTAAVKDAADGVADAVK